MMAGLGREPAAVAAALLPFSSKAVENTRGRGRGEASAERAQLVCGAGPPTAALPASY